MAESFESKDVLVDSINRLMTKASPLPWSADTIETEYGDSGKGYSQVMYGGKDCLTIFDALNASDVSLRDDRCEGPDGPEGSLYDETASANFAFIEALVNAWPEIAKRLASVPAWNRMSDKKPIDGEYVLLYDPKQYGNGPIRHNVMECYYDRIRDIWDNANWHKARSAKPTDVWTELPKPPEELRMKDVTG